MARPANPGRVVELVAEWHYLTVHELVSPSHPHEPHISRARRRAVMMIRRLCGYGWAHALRTVGYSPAGTNGALKNWAFNEEAKSSDDLIELEAFIRERL